MEEKKAYPGIIYKEAHLSGTDLLKLAPSIPQADYKLILDTLNDYYHNDQELIEDEIYDSLQELYEEKFEPYTQVGAPPRVGSGKKVMLPYYLGSLSKIKSEKEVTKWASNHPGNTLSQTPYLLMDKVDGLTLLYIQSGNTKQLFTRGRGIEGKDVSHLIPYLRFPQLPFDIAVRGEAVIFKDDYEKYAGEFSNPRAMASGVVNAEKSFRPDLAKLIHFMAFHIMNSADPPSGEIQWLTSAGFETPVAGLATKEMINQKFLEDYLVQRRKEAPYEMDGIVVYEDIPITYPTDRAPENIIAFKIPSEMAISTVTEVTWEAQKDGHLRPRIWFEPVRLAGTNVTKASGLNGRYIVLNNIGPGAKVLVTKRGEIIPYIEKVLEPSPSGPQWPDQTKYGQIQWDANEVQLIASENNPESMAAKIEYFLDKIDVKNIGPERVKTLVYNGLTNLTAFLQAPSETFERVLGPTIGQKIYQELHSKIKDVPLNKLMAASGIFPGLAEKKFSLILTEYPDVLTMNISPEELTKKVSEIKGFDKMSVNFVNALPAFKQWLASNPMVTYKVPQRVMVAGTYRPVVQASGPSIMQESIVPPEQNMAGLKVVFSGFRSPSLANQILLRGGENPSNVSSKTTAANSILVLQSFGKNDSKERYAKEHGIPMMTRQAFVEKYGLQD